MAPHGLSFRREAASFNKAPLRTVLTHSLVRRYRALMRQRVLFLVIVVLQAIIIGGWSQEASDFAVWQTHFAVEADAWPQDPDRDGFTNGQEAAFGTDPGDAQSTPALTLLSTGNASRAVTWFGVAHQVYQCQWSADLKAWQDLESPKTGANARLTLDLPLGNSIRFLRLAAMTPADDDGDGLNNLEEGWLGTARDLADSDGDGVSDGTEWLQGRDPLMADGIPPEIDPAARVSVGMHQVLYVNERGKLEGYGGADSDARDHGVIGSFGIQWAEIHGHALGAHSLLLTTDGKLGAMGLNRSGAFGIDRGFSTRPILVSGETWQNVAAGVDFSLGIREDGSLWGWGKNDDHQVSSNPSSQVAEPEPIGIRLGWKSLAAGRDHSLAIDADGALWGWGTNDRGQIGSSDRADVVEPRRIGESSDWTIVAAGSAFSLGIKANGTLWAWGKNGFGQLGIGSRQDQTDPIQVGEARDWIALSAGDEHALGLKRDGSLWAWGRDDHDRLGDSTFVNITVPTQILSDKRWKTMAAGRRTSAAVSVDDELWTWGDNQFGQLGYFINTLVDEPAPVEIHTDQPIVSIFADTASSMAIDASGRLWGWGYNIRDGLGDDTNTTYHWLPVALHGETRYQQVAPGDQHGFGITVDGELLGWGDKIASRPISLAPERRWKKVSGYGESFLAIAEDGTLWGWGWPLPGSLGDPQLLDDPKWHSKPVMVSDQPTWTQIIVGAGFSLAMQLDGSIWTSGTNLLGLGLGRTKEPKLTTWTPVEQNGFSWSSVFTGAASGFGIERDGTLWAWGNNHAGTLGEGTTDYREIPVRIPGDWLMVDGSNAYSVGITRDGRLWSWGRNHQGQLGAPTVQQRLSPVVVGNRSDWKQVACGDYHVLALRENGTVWSWGQSWQGQTGNVSRDPRPVPEEPPER